MIERRRAIGAHEEWRRQVRARIPRAVAYMASDHPNLISFYIGPARNYAAPCNISIYRIDQLYSAWLWKNSHPGAVSCDRSRGRASCAAAVVGRPLPAGAHASYAWETMEEKCDGNAQSAHEMLFATLYDELHRVAERQLRSNAAITVSPTTLLHETFLNMNSRDASSFKDREHFMAYASRAMRGLLIDRLCGRAAQKRGGEFELTRFPTEVPEAFTASMDLEAIHAALEQLAATHPRLAGLVDLKFFCGFSFEEIGGLLKISSRTVKRDWEKARILLYGFLRP
jgi:RNA polymerase sigma factor (TIGR02999 family)